MQDPTPEVWVPIVGYEGRYDVSDQGRIRSYAKGKLTLRPNANHGDGYRSIRLFDGEGYRTRMVHHLVLEAFVGPRPTPKHETAHANDDRSDNRPSNLRWATKAENTLDKVISGGSKLGRRPRLNADQVREIRAKAESGHGLKAIAELYDVSTVTIWEIQTRRTWATLD